ncbi:RNA polymerase sigma factor SigM [Kitasatospora azatica]|uniref:RNA polymerase sigma factor SigM n=1 Tax=Kitasatospora azatica TaxID=58347 RepID=UPI00068EC51E|nr:RNA polymerase sigma factor SigM [Kitasatospora azatica]
MAEPARPGAEQAPWAGEESDAELLARHVAGDTAAFGLLVQRHRDRLWAIALRTLGDREEAADALQDALVSALRSAHTFQGRSAVTTWLHRIVVNACLDRARRATSRRTGSLDEQPQQLDTLVPAAEPAEALVIRQELRRELGAALAELPPEQRAALVLVDMQGYPVAEAAELLGVPVGTVKSRCARGRARLLPLVRHLRETEDVVSGGVSRETPPPGNPAAPGSVPSAPALPRQDLTKEGDATPR